MADIQLQPINEEQQVDIGGEPEGQSKWWRRPYYVAAGIVLIVLVFSIFVCVITLGAATGVSVSNDDQNGTYIVGGQPGDSPSAVSVQRYGRHRCSGSLVDHQHVLLPAQCIEKINLKALTLQLGRKTLDEEGGETRHVTDFRVDPNWRSGGRRWSYDQALLKMDRPVDFTEDIQPASLAGDGSVFPAGTEAKVCGWGRVEQGKPLPKPRTLQCGNVTVTPHGLCKQIYQGKVDDNMICAGNMGGGQDACRGDAGAALMFKQGDDWIMAGQVIRGPKECGAPNSPTVYWIRSKEFITTAIEEMRECGTRPVLGPPVGLAVGRIIGGQEAIPHSWPWMAHYRHNGIGSPWSATLIHESFVLTHGAISVGDRLVFGAHSRSSTSENTQKIRVEKVYELQRAPTEVKYALALVKLSSPVKFNKHVQPICLPKSRDFPPAGKTCMITGWGRIHSEGPYWTDLLQEASATIITHEQCSRDFPYPHPEFITKYTFCTAASGAQFGDAGGPLMCENDDGSWTVYGVQFGFTGSTRYPTLYQNVTVNVPKIKQIIAE